LQSQNTEVLSQHERKRERKLEACDSDGAGPCLAVVTLCNDNRISLHVSSPHIFSDNMYGRIKLKDFLKMSELENHPTMAHDAVYGLPSHVEPVEVNNLVLPHSS
jgi:hypothetical protein